MQGCAFKLEVAQDSAERSFQIGLGERLARGPGGQKDAVDQHDLIAEIGNAAEVVGGDQHQVAALAELAQQFDDRALGLDVDAGERLVEQDDLAFLGQGAGQEDALLLSARQLADLALAEARHADAFECGVDLAAVVLRGDAQEAHVAVAAHHHHVFDEDREVPVDVLALGDVGDAGCASGRRRTGKARDGDLAARRANEAHDGLEEGGLAAAVDADQAADRARCQLERHVLRGQRGHCG